jgi:hypothetical protein
MVSEIDLQGRILMTNGNGRGGTRRIAPGAVGRTASSTHRKVTETAKAFMTLQTGSRYRTMRKATSRRSVSPPAPAVSSMR